MIRLTTPHQGVLSMNRADPPRESPAGFRIAPPALHFVAPHCTHCPTLHSLPHIALIASHCTPRPTLHSTSHIALNVETQHCCVSICRANLISFKTTQRRIGRASSPCGPQAPGFPECAAFARDGVEAPGFPECAAFARDGVEAPRLRSLPFPVQHRIHARDKCQGTSSLVPSIAITLIGL